MKNYAKKLLLTATVSAALVTGAFITQAKAVDNADVEASVETRTAISVVKTADIDFGRLDVEIATQAATLILDPTSGAIAGASATVVPSGTPLAGRVTITADGASNVDIICNASATLINGNADTLTMSDVRVEAISGGTYVSTICTGAAQGITAVTDDEIVLGVGGTLALVAGGNEVKAGSFLGVNAYDTATGAGVPVNIRAVYQ